MEEVEMMKDKNISARRWTAALAQRHLPVGDA